MLNSLGMPLAFAFISLIFTGANYYIITRRITLFGGKIKRKWTILLISLCITLGIIALFTAQFSNTQFFSIIGSLASRYFILIPLLSVIMGIEHLVTASFRKGGLKGTFTRGIITISIFCLFFAYGLRASFNTKITHVNITTDKTPKDIHVMLVADIHVDDILSTVHLKELKKQIEKQQPDFVLIAGDFFNRANLRQAEYYETLQGIDIPMYAIQGNHDTMGNLQALNRIAELTNMQFLYNESLMLPDINMQIIGIEEHGQRKNATINEILTKSNIQSGNTFNILLTHQPVGLRKFPDAPIDLEVAGHTHKLQIRGMHFLSYIINDYTYGLYKWEDKKAFVTQGIGTRGLPIRIGTRSEIVMMHLLSNLKEKE